MTHHAMPAYPPELVMTCRLRRAAGSRRTWIAGNGQMVELPVVVSRIAMRPEDREVFGRSDATIELVGQHPQVTSYQLASPYGLDLVELQASFRWLTPIDIITVTVPQLLARDADPFDHEYATHGYPDAAHIEPKARNRLTDGFLAEVAGRYVALGRGYSATLAKEYDVSPRTVVSWIEKARERGILSAARPGAAGGYVIAPAERPQPS